MCFGGLLPSLSAHPGQTLPCSPSSAASSPAISPHGGFLVFALTLPLSEGQAGPEGEVSGAGRTGWLKSPAPREAEAANAALSSPARSPLYLREQQPERLKAEVGLSRAGEPSGAV